MKNLIKTTMIVLLILTLSFPLWGSKKEKISLKFSEQIPMTSKGTIVPTVANGDTLLNESFEGALPGWSVIDNDSDWN